MAWGAPAASLSTGGCRRAPRALPRPHWLPGQRRRGGRRPGRARAAQELLRQPPLQGGPDSGGLLVGRGRVLCSGTPRRRGAALDVGRSCQARGGGGCGGRGAPSAGEIRCSCSTCSCCCRVRRRRRRRVRLGGTYRGIGRRLGREMPDKAAPAAAVLPSTPPNPPDAAAAAPEPACRPGNVESAAAVAADGSPRPRGTGASGCWGTSGAAAAAAVAAAAAAARSPSGTGGGELAPGGQGAAPSPSSELVGAAGDWRRGSPWPRGSCARDCGGIGGTAAVAAAAAAAVAAPSPSGTGSLLKFVVFCTQNGCPLPNRF